ncbi:MAG: carbamoyl transferase [Nitrospira sp.]|nr:carbamoyl transferase [Nitrospira sp.]
MNILGVAFLTDASAAVIRDGVVVAAIGEERLNRVKLWNGIPRASIAKALELAGLSLEQIDLVATHGAAPLEPDARPFEAKEAEIRRSDLAPDRREAQLDHLRSRLAHERWVLGSRTPAYLDEIRALGRPVRIYGHHEAHAASAYYGSGWDECTVLTIDGWGEDGSSTLWQGAHGKLLPLARTYTFDSLGYFYGAVTKALGFTPHRHEGKILGLAAYCTDSRSYPTLRTMIDYDSSAKRFLGRMERGLYIPRFENPYLKELVTAYSREDIAAGAQRSLEEVVGALIADLGNKTKLAVAGGVFANVKLTQRLNERPNVDGVYVFPNMGDGGLSVGAAWLAHVQETGRRPAPLRTMLLGPALADAEIEAEVSREGLRYRRVPDIEEHVAALLAQGHVVARVRGRMEFGPRALGNRSILYHAADASVNQWLNQQLHRSEFMPFAPATLAEHADACYEGLGGGREPAKYMAITCACTPRMRAEAPAAVHVDGTARPQVVSWEDYPEFHRLLTAYHRLTGRASVVNTSFNMHEEPIVCTARDAVRAFQAGRLPYLAIEDFLVEGKG